ncbi:MAG: Rieske 2Fe-2S domain-containing protein [Rhodobacteraceae bacterium]|nr:Rieske 2Fe-2S domain-containing protein [Paracoccaceae bacterium]MYF46078.1 Rieske 2Fe-2S domain-containing protein [Paracoccaceae bacterium]MYI92280.1 Rieske 2Fe-2S domain-containing protein [Paracoccaceae bacterium]
MDVEADRDLELVRQAVEGAKGLPNNHYIDQATYEEEREVLLFNNWAGIGLGSDIPNPGDVSPVNFAGMPLLMVRNHEGDIQVFQNTCRHRGMKLVEKNCNLRGTIRCPYHSWSYNLDGSLRATPHVGGPGMNIDKHIVREDLGLTKINTHIWRDIVFVNVSGTAPTFREYASKLLKRWHEHEQPMYHGGPVSGFNFDVACNWKLAVENYCESYHLPWIHPGLNSYSRLEDHYHIEEPGHFSGQGTLVYRQIIGEKGEKFPDFKNLSKFWNTGAEYIVLFPNVMLATQRDHGYAIILLPQGPERTIERNEIFYSFDPETRPDLKALIEKNSVQWRGVLEEDLFVVEGMQKGRHGIFFDGGKFSPVMDSPTHVFHKWVGDKLHASRYGNT